MLSAGPLVFLANICCEVSTVYVPLFGFDQRLFILFLLEKTTIYNVPNCIFLNEDGAMLTGFDGGQRPSEIRDHHP